MTRTRPAPASVPICSVRIEALGVIAAAKLAGEPAQKFLEVVRQDAAKPPPPSAWCCPSPLSGSQAIDNLNASIHMRALLTDLFLLDETLKITGSLKA